MFIICVSMPKSHKTVVYNWGSQFFKHSFKIYKLCYLKIVQLRKQYFDAVQLFLFT